jgi:hypothetical protein
MNGDRLSGRYCRRKPPIKVNELRTTAAKLAEFRRTRGTLDERRALFTILQPCIGLREIDIAAVL